MKKSVLLILLFLALGNAFAQKIGVKSNLLYDAMTSINLGIELGIAPQWTVDVSGNYNAWTFSDNHKIKHWFVQPEARWWTCQKFSGHFVGAHLLGGE